MRLGGEGRVDSAQLADDSWELARVNGTADEKDCRMADLGVSDFEN